MATSRYSRWRVASLVGVHVLIAAHIAHWLLSGRTLAPLELNEVLYTLHLGVVTAGFLFMALAMVSVVVFGRFFCGWACHVLALQDLSAWLLGKLRIRPEPFRSRALTKYTKRPSGLHVGEVSPASSNVRRVRRRVARSSTQRSLLRPRSAEIQRVSAHATRLPSGETRTWVTKAWEK